ncbi:hypothetical protein RZE82_07190 [Mollicutes bacterium LVI A0039]|nr:hypothetical protein RZE82_07190 [Mollicutes bacterium LVI A0039]
MLNENIINRKLDKVYAQLETLGLKKVFLTYYENVIEIDQRENRILLEIDYLQHKSSDELLMEIVVLIDEMYTLPDNIQQNINIFIEKIKRSNLKGTR